MMGRGSRNCSFLRNWSRAFRHSSISVDGTPRNERYFEKCSRCRGKTQLMQGDLSVLAHKANSSSCGEAMLHSILSIGLRLGRKNEMIGASRASAERKICGKLT